jgi:hypothetical protein
VLVIGFSLAIFEEAIYLTAPGNAASDVATGAVAVVTGLAISGVVAAAAGSTITITGATFRCGVIGPPSASDHFSASVSANAITFSGSVDGDDYGIYVDVYPGGTATSFGIFVNPPKKSDAQAMAVLVAAALSKIPAPLLGQVTFSQTGAKVAFTNAEEIECRITDDIRVGQPDPSFGSPCSRCCSHRIGRVLDARLDVDAALIQLDPGIKYKPEIQDVGPTVGMQPPTQFQAVVKRGRTTGRTIGLIRSLKLSGRVGGSSRLYSNAFMIESGNQDHFSAPGDSGSSVVNLSGDVVGLLWGGYDVFAYATPIDQVVAAFPSWTFNFAPAPAAGQAADAVRTVPSPAAHMEAAPEALAAATRPVLVSGRLEARLNEVEREVTASPAGKQYAQLIRCHFAEGQTLINKNRRVATAWHRNFGPEILQAVLRMIQRRDFPLPKEIHGKPLSECLDQLERVMGRYASPGLSADLDQYLPRLAGLAGLTYNEVLQILQSWPGER